MSCHRLAVRAMSALCLLVVWCVNARAELATAADHARLSSPANAGRFSLAATSGLDGRIYALGGSDGVGVGRAGAVRGLRTADAYDPASGKWTELAPMSVPRMDLGAATGRDGRIYAVGGRRKTCDSDYAPMGLSSAEVYDPQTGAWAALPPMPTRRARVAVATGPDGQIYAIGGQNVCFGDDVVPGYALQTVEAYDPDTGHWRTAPPLPTAGAGLGAVTGPDGRIYVMGTTTMEAYDVHLQRWVSRAPPPDEDFPDKVVAVLRDRIYTVAQSGRVYEYSISTNQWSRLPPIPAPHDRLALAAGGDGRIYAIGGMTRGDGQPVGTVEAYDPRTNAWANVAPLPATGPPSAWRIQLTGARLPMLYSIACPSVTTCYATGTDRILKTTDGGATWRVLTHTSQDMENGPISCPTPDICYEGSNNGATLATLNGGRTWTRRQAGQTPFLSLACPGPTTCVAARPDGLTVTNDGGKTWKRTASAQRLYRVACPSAAVCYAVGWSGTILVSGDGGKSWRNRSLHNDDHLMAVACPDVAVCFAVDGDGTEVRTTDGGATWQPGPRLPVNMRGLACTGTLLCYAAGQNGRIMATKDGGQTWQRENSGTTLNLMDVACPGSAACYVVGAGIILKRGNAAGSR